MQKITPFLWFDNNAREAMKFYTSIFKNSKILGANRFRIEGQEFIAFDGGPQFKFTEAISIYVDCKTQKEVDTLWEKLSAGGRKSRCGWLKDKYGLSWQIIPSVLIEMLTDDDEEKSGRAMQAMLQMNKIDIQALQRAYNAGSKPVKAAKRKSK
jgi:predicted 3-demethylubiquinone-9 3-methyltransferase (glyoxalase superfamily)